MDANTLKTDIQTVVNIIEAIEGLFPNGTQWKTYTNFLANVVEDPAVLALFVAWINTLQAPPVPAPTK